MNPRIRFSRVHQNIAYHRFDRKMNGIRFEGGMRQHEEEQGAYSSDSSNNNSSTSNGKRLNGRWHGASSFLFDRGKSSPTFPRHDMFKCSIA